MADYKYSYIADKELFKATMFACKMIRENGYFNKAIKIASNYYDVDEDKLTEEVRKRQAAGQKNSTKTRKYKWYIVEEYTHHQYRDDYYEHVPNVDAFKIVRATSKANVNKTSKPYGWGFQNESYSVDVMVSYGEFETKEEAEAELQNLKNKE